MQDYAVSCIYETEWYQHQYLQKQLESSCVIRSLKYYSCSIFVYGFVHTNFLVMNIAQSTCPVTEKDQWDVLWFIPFDG